MHLIEQRNMEINQRNDMRFRRVVSALRSAPPQPAMCFISGSGGLVVQVVYNYLALWLFSPEIAQIARILPLIELFREVVQVTRFSILPK